MEYKKCSNCKCYRDDTQFEKRKNGEIFKTCNKCRGQKVDEPDNNKVLNNLPVWTKDIKENNRYKGDININTETPNNINMDKCIVCLNIWERPKDIYPKTTRDITCYICREKGEIKDELYNLNEPVKNKIPVWTPDSSESD